MSTSSLPFEADWLRPPAAASSNRGELRIVAGARTDLFIDPASGLTTANAPALVGPVEGDFMFAARVVVDLQVTFDAGGLLVWVSDTVWAKLLLELSPQRERTIVSVVTRGRSDDCNSRVLEGNAVDLRISRSGSAYAFHASYDPSSWTLVRHFDLPAPDDAPTLLGVEAQSPLGEGCVTTFSAMELRRERLRELRDGS